MPSYPLRKTIVYGLVDPDTREIMYVGRTVNPYARMVQHLKARGNSHRDRWIRDLQEEGKEPTMIVLDVLERDSADAERIWILGLEASQELLNVNLPGGRPKTKESIVPRPIVRPIPAPATSNAKTDLAELTPDERGLAAAYVLLHKSSDREPTTVERFPQGIAFEGL
jgi:hypothetical protein